MRILINDHAGHPFQVQLSRSLAKRGNNVLHTYCTFLSTPRGSLKIKDEDPGTFDVKGVSTQKEFSRYSLISRYFQEKELGRGNVENIEVFKPDVVISANTPLGTQSIIINRCLKNKIKFIFWVQDLLGIGIRNYVKKKLPVLGNFIGWYYYKFEQRLLRKSNEIVIITDDFQPITRSAGIPDEKVHVIENWAPLDEMPIKQKSNQWSRRNGLDKKFCFLYSGTLGMKHNPELLVDLALAFKNKQDVVIVVVSEGMGSNFLRDKKTELNLANLILKTFQPFEDLPDVLGSADVLIAILETDAGIFAVPSKVLSYLCTQRSLLLAVPHENLASRIVLENKGGLTVSPSDHTGFINAAKRLYQDGELRSKIAFNARMYAERTFDIEKITDQFEAIISNNS